MVRWMPTRFFGGFFDCLMAERHIAAHAYQRTCGASQNWWTQPNQRGTSSITREKWKCTPPCTSSTICHAILSTARPSLPFEVVANHVFCGSCGYIPHVCCNQQYWTPRKATQIPGFKKPLCIRHYTHSRWDRPKSFRCTLYSSNYEVLGIEWAVAGIYMSHHG